MLLDWRGWSMEYRVRMYLDWTNEAVDDPNQAICDVNGNWARSRILSMQHRVNLVLEALKLGFCRWAA